MEVQEGILILPRELEAAQPNTMVEMMEIIDHPHPNKPETQRGKLTFPQIGCVNAKMFLGRGHLTKWFVPQQPLAATRPMSSGTCES